MFKSKTIIVNIIAIIVVIVGKVFGVDVDKESVLGFLMDPAIQAILIAIINFILRFFTNKPLSEKKSLMK